MVAMLLLLSLTVYIFGSVMCQNTQSGLILPSYSYLFTEVPEEYSINEVCFVALNGVYRLTHPSDTLYMASANSSIFFGRVRNDFTNLTAPVTISVDKVQADAWFANRSYDASMDYCEEAVPFLTQLPIYRAPRHSTLQLGGIANQKY